MNTIKIKEGEIEHRYWCDEDGKISFDIKFNVSDLTADQLYAFVKSKKGLKASMTINLIESGGDQ